MPGGIIESADLENLKITRPSTNGGPRIVGQVGEITKRLSRRTGRHEMRGPRPRFRIVDGKQLPFHGTGDSFQ